MESMELPDDIFAGDCVTEEITASHRVENEPTIDEPKRPPPPVEEERATLAPSRPPAASRNPNLIKVVHQPQLKAVAGSPAKLGQIVTPGVGVAVRATHVRNLNNSRVVAATAGSAPKSLIRPAGSALLAQHLTGQSPHRPVMIRGAQMQGYDAVVTVPPL